MPKKKTKLDQFADLTWNDLEEWAGSKIVSRGKNYQREGRVCDLAITEDGGLIAWVDGTERYAVKVVMDDSGLPDSVCTCPFAVDCKHGVAVVVEYLKQMENNRSVSKAGRDDVRLRLLEDEDWDDDAIEEEMAASQDMPNEIGPFLNGKTKAELIELIHAIAQQHPEIAQALEDRRQLTSGNTQSLVTRLRREIQEIGYEPGWQDYWRDGGYTPDYSEIRMKLETLLEAGHPDEVLKLGRELITIGIRQVEVSHDAGETAMEIADCMPVIVRALDRSSLDPTDKLNWALDAELKDQYEVCSAFVEYLHREHPKSAWHAVADRLLLRLRELKHSKGADDFSRNYERDRLSNWAIFALKGAGRKDEIIPLCEAEAQKTGSYERLVKILVSARRYEEAERWIRQGIRATKDKRPGIAGGLRNTFREIRTQQKNWPEVAAIQVEEFIRSPSRQAFTSCRKAAARVMAWPQVRESLLQYLEKAEPPWKSKDWPLPESGLDMPETGRKDRYPMVRNLIEIAILEKDPAKVLYWYDRLPKNQYGGYGIDDEVAVAVQAHAPDRAVAIWKSKAESLIAQVKPKAYQEAGRYLRKIAKVMAEGGKQAEWDRYLQNLREHHARKIRLIAVLNSIDKKPIIKKKTTLRRTND